MSVNMIPFQAMRNTDDIRREIDRIYRFPFSFFEENFSPGLTLPYIDVYETDDQVIVSCDIPGLQKKEDVHIDLDNNQLTISGQLNREQHVVQEDRMHRKERFSGQFRRSISLPAHVSGDQVSAIYKNGVLNIFLPKTTSESKKAIDIQFEH